MENTIFHWQDFVSATLYYVMALATESHSSKSWTDWWADNSARFLLFARQQCRTEEDARDVVQEALARLWKWRGGKGPPPDAPLVYTTIRRAAIDQIRSNDRRTFREVAYDGEKTTDAWFDPSLEQREFAMEVQAAVDKLSPKLREAVVLKVWGGLTFAQIAETLEIPMSTAASRVRLALEELKQLLSASLRA